MRMVLGIILILGGPALTARGGWTTIFGLMCILLGSVKVTQALRDKGRGEKS